MDRLLETVINGCITAYEAVKALPLLWCVATQVAPGTDNEPDTDDDEDFEPFGDIEETLLYLAKEPTKIYEWREPGLPKTLPPPEPFTIAAKYDGKPYEIKGTIHYHLNDAYDAFYRTTDKKDKKGDKGADEKR